MYYLQTFVWNYCFTVNCTTPKIGVTSSSCQRQNEIINHFKQSPVERDSPAQTLLHEQFCGCLEQQLSEKQVSNLVFVMYWMPSPTWNVLTIFSGNLWSSGPATSIPTTPLPLYSWHSFKTSGSQSEEHAIKQGCPNYCTTHAHPLIMSILNC